MGCGQRQCSYQVTVEWLGSHLVSSVNLKRGIAVRHMLNRITQQVIEATLRAIVGVGNDQDAMNAAEGVVVKV